MTSNVVWRKASSSINNGGCVEVAQIEGGFAVRDSKDPQSPVLYYTAHEWHRFVQGVKNGEFNGA